MTEAGKRQKRKDKNAGATSTSAEVRLSANHPKRAPREATQHPALSTQHCLILFCLLPFTFCLALSAHAQPPSADWRTYDTPHFRVHFPAEYEQWATRAASRLEAVRTAVVTEVGYDPPEKIDVVVQNPIAQPNGIAWPFLDAPRIELYAEAPEADEQIGSYSHWIDLLTVHEVTHVIHMLRPSRNRTRNALERFLLPLGSISNASPRWVLEGYATVVEGRLTGSGRPTSTMRAAILRKWASSGRLPSYEQLDSDQRFLGMSMAYLAGSAYLEWLETRAGAGSLRSLWARLTAREKRSFDDAFIGVFGDSPERLYGLFTAELTASAVTITRSGLQEGELWQETRGATGDPAVSPDGSQLALVIRPRRGVAKLVIFDTGENEEAATKDREAIAKMLERDPQDVAPLRTKPLPRKPKHTLTLPDRGDIESPRWTRDERSLIYTHRQPDADGVLHFDLFRWTPASGENRRITRLADLRDADPLPGDTQAIAVRSRHGLTQLVRVDLASGTVRELTTPSLDVIASHPRVSPDGSRLAWVEHRQGHWRLMIAPLDANALDGARELANTLTGELANALTGASELALDASSPEWAPDGTLYATISTRGFAEIHRIAAQATPVALTRTAGAAFTPAPSRDGRVFFMSLEPDGFVVRVIAAGASAATPATIAECTTPPCPTLVPAIPPPAPQAAPFAVQELAPARAYGMGRQERRWIGGQSSTSSENSTELGMRVGDIAGRLDTIALLSLGNARGATVASAWRGWPVTLSAQAFTYDCRASSSACSSSATSDMSGLEVRAAKTHRATLWELEVSGGLLGATYDRSVAFAETALLAERRFGALRTEGGVQLSAARGDLSHTRGVVRAGAGTSAFTLAVQWQRDQGDRIALGGLPVSILPDSAMASRVFDPALPMASHAGRDYDGRRIALSLRGLPLMAFHQQHRIGNDDIGVTGLELSASGGPNAILGLPRFEVTLGVARLGGDTPDRGDTRWWLGMRYTP